MAIKLLLLKTLSLRKQINTAIPIDTLSITYEFGGQRDSAVVKSACCSCGGLSLVHSTQVTVYITPASEDPVFLWTSTCTHIQTLTHTQRNTQSGDRAFETISFTTDLQVDGNSSLLVR